MGEKNSSNLSRLHWFKMEGELGYGKIQCLIFETDETR